MRQPERWLFSAAGDLLALGLPVWATWIFCFSLPDSVHDRALPLWMWALFIVGIDVSHVWSTLFRTYLDRHEFARHRALLIRAPFLAFALFFLIASISSLWFWRAMAYLALFHFVRQQFGFFFLYGARFGHRMRHRLFSDKGIIYLATLYPVAHWHLSGVRNFDWFVAGDFLTLPLLFGAAGSLEALLEFANLLYWSLIAIWCAEEIVAVRQLEMPVPVGKLAWLLTTAGTWYLGIVHFNSDVAFTLTNVVAHGLPYIALIAFYNGRKREEDSLVPRHRTGARRAATDVRSASDRRLNRHGIASIGFMIGVILLLAYGEEYLWDMLLYRERGMLFESLFAYPLQALSAPATQALALALLSVPQVTHYIVDGFIWKISGKNPQLTQVFSLRPVSK